MEIGVYGQPGSSAAKWAAEGNTFAYLYEGEGVPVPPADWAAKMVAGGIRKFVLQSGLIADALALGAIADVIPRGGIIGMIPGAPDPNKGGAPVYDEPTRSGVTATAFRDFARVMGGLQIGGQPVPRWMNFQGDDITSGPSNLKPAAPGGGYKKVPYDVWTEQVEYAGIDWHVAARGTYPVGLIALAFDRLNAWSGGAKRLVAVLERGPQTASDGPRYLTADEIVCQTGIAIAMGAYAIVGFYTREPHPTRGGFSFDPRDAAQIAGSIRANAIARRFDDPAPNAYTYVDAKWIKDKNTAEMVRDAAQGYILKATRTIDGGRTPVVVEVNCSHVRAIASDVDGALIPALGVRFNGQPELPPVAGPVVPPPGPVPPGDPGDLDETDPTPIQVTRGAWNQMVNANYKLALAVGAAVARIEGAAAAGDLANQRLDRIAAAAGRPADDGRGA